MITFESVSTERIEQLRVLNQVIFPISYNQSFYHAVLQNSVFCILALDSDHLRTANETCIGAICCRRERNGVPVLASGHGPASILNSVQRDAARADSMSTADVIAKLNTSLMERRDDGLTSGPPDSLYIMTIGILAPYRRLGIGSSLLSSLITRATDDPTLAYIQLHVQITNTEALAFYAKYGFRVVVRVDGYYRLNKGVIPPDAYLLRRNVKDGLPLMEDELCPHCASAIATHSNFLPCTPTYNLPPYPHESAPVPPPQPQPRPIYSDLPQYPPRPPPSEVSFRERLKQFQYRPLRRSDDRSVVAARAEDAQTPPAQCEELEVMPMINDGLSSGAKKSWDSVSGSLERAIRGQITQGK